MFLVSWILRCVKCRQMSWKSLGKERCDIFCLKSPSSWSPSVSFHLVHSTLHHLRDTRVGKRSSDATRGSCASLSSDKKRKEGWTWFGIRCRFNAWNNFLLWTFFATLFPSLSSHLFSHIWIYHKEESLVVMYTVPCTEKKENVPDNGTCPSSSSILVLRKRDLSLGSWFLFCFLFLIQSS